MDFPLPRTDCCVAAALCKVHSRGQHEGRRRAWNESSLSNKAVKHALYLRVRKREEDADQQTRLLQCLQTRAVKFCSLITGKIYSLLLHPLRCCIIPDWFLAYQSTASLSLNQDMGGLEQRKMSYRDKDFNKLQMSPLEPSTKFCAACVPF